MPDKINKQTPQEGFLDRFPFGWFILLVIILPSASLYFNQILLAIVLLALGIVISMIVMMKSLGWKFGFHVPWSLHSKFLMWWRGDNQKHLWEDLYPFLVLSILTAWWVTNSTGQRLTEKMPTLFQWTISSAIFVIVLVILIGLGALLQRRPWMFTIFYGLLFLGTLTSYYSQTLHYLFEALGWKFAVLGRSGDWTPSKWPLGFGVTCLILIGAVLIYQFEHKSQSWHDIIQERITRGLIFILWMVTIIFIIDQAMLALYSNTTVFIVTILLPFLLYIVFGFGVGGDRGDVVHTIEAVEHNLGVTFQFVLKVPAVSLFLLLFVFKKFGDLLKYPYRKFIRPIFAWVNKLWQSLAIVNEKLDGVREWLVIRIFESSIDEIWDQDHPDIRDMADADLLG